MAGIFEDEMTHLMRGINNFGVWDTKKNTFSYCHICCRGLLHLLYYVTTDFLSPPCCKLMERKVRCTSRTCISSNQVKTKKSDDNLCNNL